MKLSLLLFVTFLILTGCSFDNKSGIWTSTDISKNEVKDQFKDFETLYTQEKNFNEIIFPKKNLQINLSSVIRNIDWNDEFYENSNNSENFYLKDFNEVNYKSKKLSSKKLNSKFLFDGKNVITADAKGNLIVHTIEDRKTIYKFNFYKKKFKKINKKAKLYKLIPILKSFKNLVSIIVILLGLFNCGSII